jgi:hypothetical protein
LTHGWIFFAAGFFFFAAAAGRFAAGALAHFFAAGRFAGFLDGAMRPPILLGGDLPEFRRAQDLHNPPKTSKPESATARTR